MFDILNQVNWIVIFIATFAYFVLGALWFTPLFGKAYDIGTGVKRSTKQKWSTFYYYEPLLNSLVVTAAIGAALYAMKAQSLYDAVVLGSLFGFSLAAVSLSNAAAPNIPRPIVFGLVVGGYHLVNATFVAALIYTFA